MNILGLLAIFEPVTLIFIMSLSLSVCLSVRPSIWKTQAPTGRIFMTFKILVFCRKFVEKFQVSLKLE